MSVESLVFGALRALVADRVYPDIAPEGVEALPRITYQQISGTAVNFLDNGTPGKENARMQVNVWAATRLQASGLARQVKAALRAEPLLSTYVLSEPIAIDEPDLRLYGTSQDFSLWTTPPA